MFNEQTTVAHTNSKVGFVPDMPLTKARSDEVRFDRLLDDLEDCIEIEVKDASNVKSEVSIEEEHEPDNYFDSADSVFGSEVSC